MLTDQTTIQTNLEYAQQSTGNSLNTKAEIGQVRHSVKYTVDLVEAGKNFAADVRAGAGRDAMLGTLLDLVG